MSGSVVSRSLSVALLLCGALLIAYGASVVAWTPLLSGLVTGTGGLALWHRAGMGGAGGHPDELEARLRRLEEGLDALREETGRNREEVERLVEEREFLRKLYPET